MQTSIFEAASDPQMRHAAIVHLPIALAMLGLLPAALSLVPRLRLGATITTIIVYALLIAFAWAGVITGEAAEGATGALPYTVAEQVHEHEEAAEKIWYFALAVTLLAAGSITKKQNLAAVSRGLMLMAALAGACWTVHAAHLGGSLVYDFGVGTPKPMTIDDLEPLERITLADPRDEFFVSTVYPILDASCIGCHTVGNLPDADLDLSTPAGLLAGGESGPVIVPGNAQASLFYQSVTHELPHLKMPKRDQKLPDDEIEALRRWINDGAVWAEPQEAMPEPEAPSPSDD